VADKDFLTPGPAVECDNCGYQPVTPKDQENETCPTCDEYAPAVTLSACPAPDPKECNDDHHDFGITMHVVEGMGK
jgi:hypothetical protein